MKWRAVALADIALVVTKGTTPTTMGKPFTDTGVNFIKAEALNGDCSLESQSFSFIDDETHQHLKRSILQEDDVLVTIAGAQVGKCGYVRAEHLPANTNQAVGIVRINKQKANSRFVYYFFKQPRTFSLCQTLGAAQAAQPNVNLTVLKGFEIPLPSQTEQDRIADVLSAYDELMENNRRRIGLLEEAARLLYREWFVRLRFPGHEHARPIHGLPEGWELVKVGSLLLKITRKKKIHTDAYLKTGPIPCVDQSDQFIGGYTDDEEALHTAPLPLIVFGDHTRVLKFVDFPFASGADGTQLIYPNRENLSPQFLYFALGAIDLSNYFYARHFKFLKEEEVLLPSAPLMHEFTRIAASGFQQIQNLRQQNQKLRAARDLLLPRLMSGEIVV